MTQTRNIRITIRGDGVAGLCCAILLQRSGYAVSIDSVDRPRVPAIVLSGLALSLMRDVLGVPNLLSGAHVIRKRVVAWRPQDPPIPLEHAAVVVSEQQILDALRSQCDPADASSSMATLWTVVSSPPLPPEVAQHPFGSRRASVSAVHFHGDFDSSAVWIESLERGWLFLVPNSADSGWLLAVGDAPAKLHEQSRYIAPWIDAAPSVSATIPAYPRIATPLSGSGWLACGSAAMAFDPICGDGTAHAVREAILAAAVIRAAVEGGDETQLRAHYEARLLAGFERHLALCADFYRQGYGGSWWEQELAQLHEGLSWCSSQRQGRTAFRYRLEGVELRPAL